MGFVLRCAIPWKLVYESFGSVSGGGLFVCHLNYKLSVFFIMKLKLKRIGKGILIGLGVLFVLFIIIGASGSSTETKEVTQIEEALVEEVSLGMFELAEIGDGLDYMKVNLWKSYEDRTLVIGLDAGTQVELLEREVIGQIEFDDGQGGYEYCRVKYEDKEGWLDCVWLK